METNWYFPFPLSILHFEGNQIVLVKFTDAKKNILMVYSQTVLSMTCSKQEPVLGNHLEPIPLEYLSL